MYVGLNPSTCTPSLSECLSRPHPCHKHFHIIPHPHHSTSYQAYVRGFIEFLCRRSVGFFSRAILVFLMKESKKRRRKQPGKLMAKFRSQLVNLPAAQPLMNPCNVPYTCQLFLRYRCELFILGVLGVLKTTQPFPKIPEEVQSLPKKSEVFRRTPKSNPSLRHIQTRAHSQCFSL